MSLSAKSWRRGNGPTTSCCRRMKETLIHASCACGGERRETNCQGRRPRGKGGDAGGRGLYLFAKEVEPLSVEFHRPHGTQHASEHVAHGRVLFVSAEGALPHQLGDVEELGRRQALLQLVSHSLCRRLFAGPDDTLAELCEGQVGHDATLLEDAEGVGRHVRHDDGADAIVGEEAVQIGGLPKSRGHVRSRRANQEGEQVPIDQCVVRCVLQEGDERLQNWVLRDTERQVGWGFGEGHREVAHGVQVQLGVWRGSDEVVPLRREVGCGSDAPRPGFELTQHLDTDPHGVLASPVVKSGSVPSCVRT